MILYYSGVGSTKNISEQFAATLNKQFRCSLFSIENIFPDFNFGLYDGFIFGYPIYHTHPPIRLLKFIDAISPLTPEKPAFIFNTRGLYSANSQRILAKHLLAKNIKIIMDQEYRSPASDVSLLAPFVKMVWKFEKACK